MADPAFTFGIDTEFKSELEMTISSIPLGTAPQWITACIAFGALITGWISIGAQREIARKRAALDFFAKTEMDTDLLSAHARYSQAVSTMETFVREGGTMARFVDEYSEHYRAIRGYLNVHELMAVGIKRNVLDDTVCYDFWSGELIRCFTDTRSLIEFIQTQPHEDGTYCEMVRVANRWALRPR